MFQVPGTRYHGVFCFPTFKCPTCIGPVAGDRIQLQFVTPLHLECLDCSGCDGRWCVKSWRYTGTVSTSRWQWNTRRATARRAGEKNAWRPWKQKRYEYEVHSYRTSKYIRLYFYDNTRFALMVCFARVCNVPLLLVLLVLLVWGNAEG